jgi:putative flavoprotein involved in K+ transport
MIYDALVIGAGQAGLATGYRLQQAGLRFLILEAGSQPGGSWPYFYDSLLLNSPARYSSLPGLPFPGDPDHYPRRDEAVAYLRDYAAYFHLPIVTGVRVAGIERTGQRFRLTTNRSHYQANTVVAASGFFGQPNLPNLPGQANYRGRILHVADYHRPEPFRGQRIVIVGGGNAAVQIGLELAQVAQVSLATRHPIRYMPQRVLGRDIHFWLHLTGLDHAQWLGDKSAPVYDLGNYRQAIALGRPDERRLFQHFTEEGVIWSDGRHERVDAVIFATGYRPNLAYLASLGALDEAGQVLQHDGQSTTVPGLYYVGLPKQRSVASATMRGVGTDARVVVRHLQRYSQTQHQVNSKAAKDIIAPQPLRALGSRWGELISLISLITFAVNQQLAGQRLAAPKLVGEAVVRSLEIGVGSLGVGHAAALYAHK